MEDMPVPTDIFIAKKAVAQEVVLEKLKQMYTHGATVDINQLRSQSIALVIAKLIRDGRLNENEIEYLALDAQASMLKIEYQKLCTKPKIHDVKQPLYVPNSGKANEPIQIQLKNPRIG